MSMKKLTYHPDLFPFWKEIEVRFRDMDPLRHANNAVFNTYFEEGRIAFTLTVPEMVAEMQAEKSFVLVKTTIEYIGQITYPMQILIGTGFTEIRNTSVVGVQAIFDKETKKLLAFAESVGVWFDTNRQRPTKFPDIPGIDRYKIALPDG